MGRCLGDAWDRHEDVRDSFDDRLAKRVEPTKERLISEAEAKIGTRLIFGPNGPDHDTPVARPLTELLAEAETQQTGERSQMGKKAKKATQAKAKETPKAVDEVTANRPFPRGPKVHLGQRWWPVAGLFEPVPDGGGGPY